MFHRCPNGTRMCVSLIFCTDGRVLTSSIDGLVQKTQCPESGQSFCLDLYKVADYFRVGHLLLLLEQGIKDWIGDNISVQAYYAHKKLTATRCDGTLFYSNPKDYSLVPAVSARCLIQAIHSIFLQGDQLKHLRDLFVDLLGRGTEYLLLQDEKFLEQILDVPELLSCPLNSVESMFNKL